jgi:hypothetical protein
MTERPTGKPRLEGIFSGTGIALMLPQVSPNVLAGLMEAIAIELVAALALGAAVGLVFGLTATSWATRRHHR